MYTPPGYREVPEGRFVPGMAMSIMVSSKGASWEPRLGDFLKTIARDARPIKHITCEDLFSASTDDYTADSPEWKRLVSFLMLILNKMGVTPQAPKFVEYISSPLLDFGTAIQEMLTTLIPWPTLDHFGGPEARVEMLKTILPTMIRSIALADRNRYNFAVALEAKLNDIAFRLRANQPIDQDELTFFINFYPVEARRSAESARGVSVSAFVLPTINVMASYTPAVIRPIENQNPVVEQVWQLYKKTGAAGPASRFYRMLSNANLEQLIYYYGPFAANLPVCIGYTRKFGPFIQPHLTRIAVLPWTEADQMAGMREKMEYAGTTDPVSLSLRAPIRLPTNNLPAYSDFPEIKLRIDQSASEDTIGEILSKQIQMTYFSKWRNREITPGEGASVESFLDDIAISQASFGEGVHSMLNMDQIPLLDWSAVPAARRPSLDSERLTERTLMPDSSGVLQLETVDMTDYYQNQGKMIVYPAFIEYVMAPRQWIQNVDPAAVSFIMSRVKRGLTTEDRIRMGATLGYLHRYEEMRRMGIQLNVNIPQFIAATTGMKLGAEAVASLSPENETPVDFGQSEADSNE